MVIDDAHHIQSTAVSEALAYFVRFLPPQTHLIMTARFAPNLPQWSGWMVRGLLDSLDASELALQADEVAEVLKKPAGSPEVAAILEQTGGWPLAIDFLAIRNPQLHPPAQSMFCKS